MEHIPTYIGVRDKSHCCLYLIIWSILFMQHPAVTSCLRFKSLSYTFTFPVKTGKPLLLLLFYFACLNHLTAITITAASLLIYRCGWEWRLNCQSLIGILVFPSSRNINLGNTSQRRFQRSPILVGIKTFSGAVAGEPSFIGKTTCYHLFAAFAFS